jgi:hypothetical protein
MKLCFRVIFYSALALWDEAAQPLEREAERAAAA